MQLQATDMSSFDEMQPYYKINKILWRWKLLDGDKGCKKVDDIDLSFEMPPPDLPRVYRPKGPPALRPKRNAGDDLIARLSAARRLKAWIDNLDPPRAPKPEPLENSKAVVPPFDIQEIPGAMRKEFMPVSAKLMERLVCRHAQLFPNNRRRKGRNKSERRALSFKHDRQNDD
jgi:hypothetical protein